MVLPGVKRGVAGLGVVPELPGKVPLFKFGVPGKGLLKLGLVGELGKGEPNGLAIPPPGKPKLGSLKPFGVEPAA